MAATKIVVSGIGAVGGYYGGLLAKHYQNSPDVEIYFIARGENLKLIKEKGLTIRQNDGSTILSKPILATEDPRKIGPVDYILCCTKSYDLIKNIESLTPLMKKDTILVPFLNGANITEQIEEILPNQEIWKGCVYIGSRLIEPGIVDKYSLKERLFFGSETAEKAKQNTLLGLLIAAGINAYNPENISLRIWKKFFMISTAATITSFYNKPIDQVIHEDYETFKALCIELDLVARKKGIFLPNDIIESTLETQKMMPPGSITSMHNDFIKQKQTEVENLTGYVVREGEKLGVNTPVYLKMYKKLKAIKSGEYR